MDSLTTAQKQLLLRLNAVLNDMSTACLADVNFNDTVARLGAFSRSIDEIAADLRHMLEDSEDTQ